MLKNNDMKPFEIDAAKVDRDKVVLDVGDCTYDDREHKLGIKVYRGEVVGFYGLVGSGERSLPRPSTAYGGCRRETSSLTASASAILIRGR